MDASIRLHRRAGAGAIGLTALLLGAAVATAPGARSPYPDPAPSTAGCPSKAQPLPGNGVAGAAKQALARAPRLYRGIDTEGRFVTKAARGPWAGARGMQIRRECGQRISRRSVVVEIQFPSMLPSASLSQGTVFVARIANRYRVWEVAH